MKVNGQSGEINIISFQEFLNGVEFYLIHNTHNTFIQALNDNFRSGLMGSMDFIPNSMDQNKKLHKLSERFTIPQLPEKNGEILKSLNSFEIAEEFVRLDWDTSDPFGPMSLTDLFDYESNLIRQHYINPDTLVSVGSYLYLFDKDNFRYVANYDLTRGTLICNRRPPGIKFSKLRWRK